MPKYRYTEQVLKAVWYDFDAENDEEAGQIVSEGDYGKPVGETHIDSFEVGLKRIK